MILRSGFKPASFISAIACTIARDEHARVDAEDIINAELDDVIYLAGCYWRARLLHDSTGDLVGVTLMNPDRTAAEIAVVEQGIAILCHFTYRAGVL